MAAYIPIQLPCGLSRAPHSMQTQGKNMAIEPHVGHGGLCALSLRDTADSTATAADSSSLRTARSKPYTQLRAIETSVLLSSRPNSSSFSQLLKKRHRMARMQMPIGGMRLPNAKEQRARKAKAKSMPRNLPKTSVGRPRKSSTVTAKTPRTSNLGSHKGSQDQPIVIDEPRRSVRRPETAPISFYTDYLMSPIEPERLVTPEISSFRYTPSEHMSPANRVPQRSYEPLLHTPIGIYKDSLAAQHELRLGQQRSSPSTSTSGWAYEQYGPYEIVSNTPTKSTPMPTSPFLKGISSFLSPAYTRAQSIYPSVEENSSEILSLADITDITLRLKVAQLLAIAPELPMQDLCNLLIGMKGNVAKARESVFQYATRATGLSPMPAYAKTMKAEPLQQAFQPQSSRGDAMVVDDSDDVEVVMTKLEMDNSEIWIDNDVLASPVPEVRKSKPTNLSKCKAGARSKGTHKHTTNTKPIDTRHNLFTSGNVRRHTPPSNRAPHTWKYPTPSESLGTPVSTYSLYQEPGYSPSATSLRNPRLRCRRGNSIDNVFVIPDTDSEPESDGMYEDSQPDADTEDDASNGDAMDDAEMESLGEDLHIDMVSPFNGSSIVIDSAER